GCDILGIALAIGYLSFNPRTPVGCDEREFPGSQPQPEGGFNPRTPVGCDGGWKVDPISNLPFQSTHPCGVRQGDQIQAMGPSQFQSTHPCGVRQFWALKRQQVL